MSTCHDPDCLRVATRVGWGGDWCEGHYKARIRQTPREERNPTAGSRYDTPWQRVAEAILAYADAGTEQDSDEDLDVARRNLKKATDAWYLHRGWRPPR